MWVFFPFFLFPLPLPPLGRVERGGGVPLLVANVRLTNGEEEGEEREEVLGHCQSDSPAGLPHSAETIVVYFLTSVEELAESLTCFSRKTERESCAFSWHFVRNV